MRFSRRSALDGDRVSKILSGADVQRGITWRASSNKPDIGQVGAVVTIGTLDHPSEDIEVRLGGGAIETHAENPLVGEFE